MVGLMPIPLRYGGAHTHRLSGDWGLNAQNLPADRKKDGKSKLRASLKAPEGHAVIVADLGQIECRLSAWLCGAEKLLQQFADKTDPYAALATEVFGRPINRKVDFIEGFIGKTGILGLGYGCGKDNFNTMVTRSARVMEIDISAVYNRDIGDAAVDAYRKLHKEIPSGWRKLDNILNMSWLQGNPMNFGPGNVVQIEKGKVIGPNGLELRYGKPELDYNTDELSFFFGGSRHKIYGAKFLENITQFLARIVVMDAAVRLARNGLRFVLQAHDELVFIVRQECVASAKELIHSEMIRPPFWAPDLPLTADVGVGNSYAGAK